MATVFFDKSTAKWTLSAVERLGQQTREWVSVDVGDQAAGASSDGDPALGLIAAFASARTPGFLDTFAKLWGRGATRFVLFAPEIGSSPRPWHALAPLQWGAFDRAVTICDRADSGALAAAISRAASETPPDWATSRLRETVEARRLHSKVRWFSHGKSRDLTNQFLAPARLLVMATAGEPLGDLEEAWRGLWQEFTDRVMTPVREEAQRYGQLGAELISAAAPIDRWLLDEARQPCSARDLDRMMALLTECRVAAGEESTQEPGRSAEGSFAAPLGPGALAPSEEPAYRVLVVDDHASAWRPVFKELQRGLERTGLRVVFEFSEDARQVCISDAGIKANIHFGFYDLVILDIFLGFSADGRSQDGRELLKRIRESLVNLPVILWTTSRDDEITRKATRANWVLLKKTITWGELEETIRVWLPKGRATGAFSLPSAFFNHVIWKKDDRELVRKLTDWGLKQLDSFHALDGKFFRFFTDHGGRHIVKLLELMEQALQPFLRNQSVAVLADDSETREFEFLALYLAIVCHELGMFPMSFDGQEENFASAEPRYLHDVRSLHALRGMALLEDSVGDAAGGRHWNDDDGRKLGQDLRARAMPKAPAIRLGDWMATIVGYHARCLSSLSEHDFLEWTAGERFARLKSEPDSLPRMDLEFQETLARLKALFTDEDTKERLRRQCALFRFVDAIDVAASRNPALFLIHSPDRDAESNREYLKRQICEKVSLDCGEVRFAALAPRPESDALGPILAQLPGLLRAEMRAACESYSARLLGNPELVGNPWLLNRRDEPLSPQAPELNDAKAFQKGLDGWLEMTWKVLMGDLAAADEGFVRHLLDQDIVAAGTDERLRATSQGKRMIASITALSVALEIQDEYRAILEAGLGAKHEGIRLDQVEWCRPEAWLAETADGLEDAPPPSLTILREGLAQYPLPPKVPARTGTLLGPALALAR